MTEPVVFISYSEQDEKEKEALLSQLGVLESSRLIDVWSNDRIGAGADWEAEIRQATAKAKVAILLITANFLTSEFILGQVIPSLLQRRESEGLVIFPIIARACAWQTVDWLAKMKVRPKDGLPIWRGDESRVDSELAAIATEVAAIVSGSPSTTSDNIPEKPQNTPSAIEHQRSFEGAMPQTSQIGQQTEVRVMVALAGSSGLRDHLPAWTEAGDLIAKKDVTQDEVPLEFPLDSANKPIPINAFIKISAPNFEPKQDHKTIYISPKEDSGVVTFLLTPTKQSEHARVLVELFKDEQLSILLGSLTLITEIKSQSSELMETVWRWATLPFSLALHGSPPTAPKAILPAAPSPETTMRSPAAPSQPREVRNINTGGGTYIEGTVETKGGDFVGHDKIVHYHTTYVTGEASEPEPETPPQPFEPETIPIPAGPFLMGSNEGDDNEAPQHEVDLPAYRIGKYPITNKEYAEFIKRTRHEPPERPNWDLREPPEGKLDHPVAGVSWLDAMAYCRWLSEETGRTYRLPSEAEWEKAASWADGQKRLYPWGNEFDASNCNSKEAGLNDTTAVGSYSPQGNSFYGCVDMIGNVQEWTSTLWGSSEHENSFPYPYQANDGREDLEASHLHFVLRVYRGSSFRDDQPRARCTLRRCTSHKGSSRWRGFRVVLEV